MNLPRPTAKSISKKAKCLGSDTFVFGPNHQLRAPLLGDPSVRGVAAQRKKIGAADLAATMLFFFLCQAECFNQSIRWAST